MSKLQNTPQVKMGLVGVSRDCFPGELCRKRLGCVVAECRKQGVDVLPGDTIVESANDAMAAVAEMKEKGANAVTVYLGNFGPEGPLTVFAKALDAPFMLCGAAEESGGDLVEGRGDALCGLLSASLNCGLRRVRPFIPETPIALPPQIARHVRHFTHVARVLIGLRGLKVFAFGPRPHDFYACNAPIQPLYDLGIEVMENSELDLLQLFRATADRKKEIQAIADDMAAELGEGNRHPEKLTGLARFELALTTFFQENLGSKQFGVYANKCWPSFEPAFGFTPCYVNSRLATRGIPAACEVDLYGGVSEYMAQLASLRPATLLDINNSVPDDIEVADLKGVERGDLFMGFHCGNTPSSVLCPGFAMKFQLIMARLMEPGKKPDISCGTLEGTLKPGPLTIFRLQSTGDGELRSYAAEGHVLDADPKSFGAIGVIGIPDFARFYRHALLEKQFAHHTAVAFESVGRRLYDAVRLLGVEDMNTPRPPARPYPTENPFGA